jgi:hypothetical protein
MLQTSAIMNKKAFYLAFILILYTSTFNACIEIEEYPEIPEISFKDFSMTLTTDILGNVVQKAKLTFHVVDGNGDIGLQDSDTIGVFSPDSIYYNDLFLTLFEKIDGEFVEKQLIVPHRYRIPYVEPQGQVKVLLADIQIAIDYTKGTFKSDTIMYSFYLYDRALNKSNVAETPELSIKELLSK